MGFMLHKFVTLLHKLHYIICQITLTGPFPESVARKAKTN